VPEQLALRLFEPVESLGLMPLTLKAVRTVGITTIEELIQNPPKQLAQGHIDEIHRKISEQRVTEAQELDWSVVLRILVRSLSSSEKIAVASSANLLHLFSFSPQQAREAEARFLKDGEEWIEKCLSSLYGLGDSLPFLRQVFEVYLFPWIEKRGGIIHREELYSFFAEKPSYAIEIVRLLERLWQQPMLFAPFLYPISHQLWAISKEKQRWGKTLIVEACALRVENQENIFQTSHMISRSMLHQWHDCSISCIERVLFWHYFDSFCCSS